MPFDPKGDSYPTARRSPDALGLGETAGQRSAELIAGLRAELDPTPYNRALASRRSRWVAALVIRTVREKWVLNHIVTRMGAMTALLRQALPEATDHPVIVEIAAGFSPRGMQLAQAMPHVQYIEIDLPDVVAEKRKRLKDSGLVDLPPNLAWIGADLGTQALADVLGSQKVHLVMAEGLNPYFSPADVTRIARRIQDNLLPGGVYICDIALEEGRQQADQAASRFFSRQAGAFLGVARDEQEARRWLLDAGYATVVPHRLSTLAQTLELPTPVLDLSLLLVARIGQVAM